MNVTQYYGDFSFLNDLDALLVEEGPTVEELEIEAFGRRVTGHLDNDLIQRLQAQPPTYYLGPYPHQVDFNGGLNRSFSPDVPQHQRRPTTPSVAVDQYQSLDFSPSPLTDQLPLTPAASNQLFELPRRTPSPQALPSDVAPTYVMELHIITKTKAKRGRGTEDFKISKPPTRISLNLTYSQFLEEIAKAAEVKQSQLDHEHMRWKYRKPASASPTNVSENESYGIMVQAIRSKKEVDRWIIVEMGKPLLSEAPWAIPGKGKYNSIDEGDDEENTRREPVVDNGLIEIVEALKRKHPIGECRIHPNDHCFSTPNGIDHWLLDRTKLLLWAKMIKTNHSTYKCPPILIPAFKNHKAKKPTETTPAVTTSGAAYLGLTPGPTPTPFPISTMPPLTPPHYHHSSPPWHGMSPHSSCASYHPPNAYHSCHPQPTCHNWQPQPTYHDCRSHHPMGPPPQSTEQFGQNHVDFNSFCVAHGLDEAARDSLKRLMLGLLQ